MKAKIKLLEERIQQVVGRLQDLTQERDRLQDELSLLRERLESLECEAPSGYPNGVPDPAWTARLGEIRNALKEAITELRRE